jgi:hypothetical protein
MALHSSSGVSVESCVQLGQDVTMRYETDALNKQVALYFGNGSEYVLILGQENLKQFLELGARALSDLDAPRE